jgi:hypothetical protein
MLSFFQIVSVRVSVGQATFIFRIEVLLLIAFNNPSISREGIQRVLLSVPCGARVRLEKTVAQVDEDDPPI